MGRFEVYYNLHKHLWSIRLRGRVIDHQEHLVLMGDPLFVVQQGGRERVLRENRKNVHAFVKADSYLKLTEDDVDLIDVDSMREITYNPYKYDSFVFVDDLSPVELDGHQRVLMPNRRVFLCLNV